MVIDVDQKGWYSGNWKVPRREKEYRAWEGDSKLCTKTWAPYQLVHMQRADPN